MQIQVDLSDIASGVVIKILGEVTPLAAPMLREALAMHMNARHDLIVDLTEVTFMDATGLSVLARAARQVRERGRHLAVVFDRRVVDRTRLDALNDNLGLHPTVECARLTMSNRRSGSATTE